MWPYASSVGSCQHANARCEQSHCVTTTQSTSSERFSCHSIFQEAKFLASPKTFKDRFTSESAIMEDETEV